MMRAPIAFVAVVTLSVTAGVTAQMLRSDPEHVRPPHVAPAAAPVAIGSPPLAAVGGESPEGVIAEVNAWVQGVLDEQERQAAEGAARMAAARQAANQPVARPGTYEGVGDCSGFAIPDYIIQRESGGDPYAVNPSSGAFGCAQVMPFHWAPSGACGDLNQFSIDDQRTCVDRLSQGGTRLSPWAATR